MMLLDLGLPRRPRGEAVVIVVGPNGSGKSNYLRDLGRHYRHSREVSVVSNTPHDRFAGMRDVNRISAGRSGQSPRTIIKRAVAATIDEPDSRFYQIGAILSYCGYEPRFGFEVDPGRQYGHPDQARLALGPEHDGLLIQDDDLERALAFIGRHRPGERIWIDPSEPTIGFSLAREFSSVLRNEHRLRNNDVLKAIRVFLARNDGRAIEIHHASSGQLALISSLVFLITRARDEPLIIIDEPENSLHPSWQREYVDKVLAAMSYRNATVVIATHAPLIVTGAVAQNPDLVSIFEIRDGRPQRLATGLAGDAPHSIEEVLWRAFEVVTPANHFVSEEIVGAISRYEQGEIAKAEVLRMINEMDARSFDPKQKRFFEGVRKLVEKVGERRTTGATDE